MTQKMFPADRMGNDLASIFAVAAQHGIKFLTPVETAELLPHANKPSRA
jgi:hypothetical protein